jgi:hypothetical protein
MLKVRELAHKGNFLVGRSGDDGQPRMPGRNRNVKIVLTHCLSKVQENAHKSKFIVAKSNNGECQTMSERDRTIKFVKTK